MDVLLGRNRRDGAVGSRRDDLAQILYARVARAVHAVHRCLHKLISHHVTAFVQLNVAAKEIRLGHSAHEHENPVGFELSPLVGLDVLDHDGLNNPVASYLLYHGVPDPFHLGIPERAVPDNRGCVQNSLIVHDDHRGRVDELREVHCLLDRSVAVADHHYVQIFEEVRIARGAVRDPLAPQLPLAGQAQSAGFSARRDDHGPGSVFVAPTRPYNPPVSRKIHCLHIAPHNLRSELLGVIGEPVHKLRAGHPAGKTGVVLH
ncbi:MAG: hypothetical protein BWY06_03472 [Candidatus Latescibacteria bacterium ADurb.Bin168]|nr:MAG: hypothetical protein BWY06_03472 [Candidatus Latescibacteria bacterium ADurb.Bin168]